MSILDTLLNKGGAGVSLSREETVHSLNPLLERHIRLNHAYRHAAAALAGTALAQPLHDALRVARMDVGKLSETILSAGGTPYTGTTLDPDDKDFPQGQQALERLADDERALLDAAEKEIGRDHHIRTLAILGNVQTHSRERLSLVERAAQKPLR